MIRTKSDYGKTKDIMVCEMGTGDIHMLGSEKAENGSVHLAFKTTKEPQPINVILPTNCDSYDEFKPELVFIYNKVESIDSMISMLQDCRTEMLNII